MTMLGSETNRKLRDMGASYLLDALEAQDDDLCMGMSFTERIQVAVDEAHSSFIDAKIEQLKKTRTSSLSKRRHKKARFCRRAQT